jgi:hypothetical protein
VAEQLTDPERGAFLHELLPKLVAYHSWLYRERDPRGRGLVTLIHPWECGLDTTPPWMDQLARMPVPGWIRLATRARLTRLLRALRYDTRHLPAAERSSDDDGLRMLVLATRARRHHFRLAEMPPARSVLVEDLAFNSFLAVANRALTRIAASRGVALPDALLASARRTERAIEELWDERSGCYWSRDAVTGAPITTPTIATFLPLWAGTPAPDRVARLVALLRGPGGFCPRHPVPSVPVDAPSFQEARYWKGPTWVNLNWAIAEGLREQGEPALADGLRRATRDLVEQGGFSEYFSPLTGRGFGAPDFSWTAALAIDLAYPSEPGASDASSS